MPKTQQPDFTGVPKFLTRLGVTKGEWQYAVKKDWRKLMSPGYDQRVKVYACLQLHTRGYPAGGGEFAITLVKTLADGTRIYAPLSPTMISAELLKVARAAVKESAGRAMTDEETGQSRARATHMRRLLHDMETQDGCLTTVTVTKYLASDAATRKLGDADLQRLMTEGLSLKDAKEQKLVVAISTLSKADRKRLAGRSFMYRDDRPATMAALRCRTEDDITASLSQASKAIHAELDGRAQLAFKFLRAEGINDPAFAAELAGREDMRLQFDEVQRLEERRLALNVGLKESIHLASEQYKIHQSSAAQIQSGKESGIPVGNAIERELPPDRRAADSTSPTMGRKTGRVEPRLGPASQSAPPLLPLSAARNSNGGPGKELMANQHAEEALTARAVDTHAAPQEGRQAGTPSLLERDQAGRSAPPLPAALVSQPRSSKPAPRGESAATAGGPDWDAVGRAAAEYFVVDDRWVQTLVAKCREIAPDIEPAEIAQLVHAKGKQAMDKRSPGGFLLTAVPHLCEGESFRRLRERIRQADREAAERMERTRARDAEQWEDEPPPEVLARKMRWVGENPKHHAAKGVREEIEHARTQTPATYVAAMQLADRKAEVA